MSDISLPDMDGRACWLNCGRYGQSNRSRSLDVRCRRNCRRSRRRALMMCVIKPINFDTLLRSVKTVFTAGNGDGHWESAASYAPNPKILMMKLYNCEKTLAMLSSEIERGKLQMQISQIRRRLGEMGYSDASGERFG